MRRIAFLGRGVHTIPSYRALVNRLTNDFDVTVFSETPIEKTWLDLQKNYRIISWCAGFLPFRINSILFFLSVGFHHLFHKFDIVHAHSTFPTGFAAVILQRIFGIPAIVSLDGGEGVAVTGLNFGDLSSRRRTRMNRWVLARARIVTTLTDFHRSLAKSHLALDREIMVIPRGVDTDHLTFKRKPNLNEPVRFVSVGYLSPVKDQKMLLRCFQLILKAKPASLTIVGRDYMNGEIQKLASDLRVDHAVRFISHIDYRDMKSIYEEADVLLHTSVYESQGLVVTEAMACGVLVSGTNVGLIHDLSDEYCVSVPVGDAQLLASRVIELMEDPSRMETLQSNSRKWAVCFSLERTASRWSEVYASLIEKQK